MTSIVKPTTLEEAQDVLINEASYFRPLPDELEGSALGDALWARIGKLRMGLTKLRAGLAELLQPVNARNQALWAYGDRSSHLRGTCLIALSELDSNDLSRAPLGDLMTFQLNYLEAEEAKQGAENQAVEVPQLLSRFEGAISRFQHEVDALYGRAVACDRDTAIRQLLAQPVMQHVYTLKEWQALTARLINELDKRLTAEIELHRHADGPSLDKRLAAKEAAIKLYTSLLSGLARKKGIA